jgi:hypothetical protein
VFWGGYWKALAILLWASELSEYWDIFLLRVLTTAFAVPFLPGSDISLEKTSVLPILPFASFPSVLFPL